MTERPRSLVARLLTALVLLGWVLGVVLVILGQLTGQRGPTPGPMAEGVGVAAMFTPLGLFVLRRAPGHPIGGVMAATGLVGTAAAVSVSWAAWLPAAWTSQWSWWPPLALIPLTLLLFPDGRLPSSRWRPLFWFLVSMSVLVTVLLAAAAIFRPRTLLTTAQETHGPARILLLLALLGIAGVAVATLPVMASQVVRWRRASSQERRQIACLIPAGVLFLAGLALDALGLFPGGILVGVVGLPFFLCLAILRYQLYDLDLYINRGLVWTFITVIVLVVFGGVGALLDALTRHRPAETPMALVAGTTIVGIGVVRGRVQREVDRLLYGVRDDPYAVLVTVSRQTELVSDPMVALKTLTQAVVDTLRVPYAAIVLAPDDGQARPTVEHGRRVSSPTTFPLIAHDRAIGLMLVACREAEAVFTAAERKLLRDVARQAALAAEVCQFSLDLQRAREGLVLAHEEERRRLRRDLHDGLGPALAGIRMQIHVLRETLRGDAVCRTMDQLVRDVDLSLGEVRRLVDGLRPPALDHGLDHALRDLLHRLDQPGIEFQLGVDAPLPVLPAAVEVAGYRIVSEAVTNVVRHSGATWCEVSVNPTSLGLRIRIADDGHGITGPVRAGAVGLASMRTRAAELGGTLEVLNCPAGVSITVDLPVRPARNPG